MVSSQKSTKTGGQGEGLDVGRCNVPMVNSKGSYIIKYKSKTRQECNTSTDCRVALDSGKKFSGSGASERWPSRMTLRMNCAIIIIYT